MVPTPINPRYIRSRRLGYEGYRCGSGVDKGNFSPPGRSEYPVDTLVLRPPPSRLPGTWASSRLTSHSVGLPGEYPSPSVPVTRMEVVGAGPGAVPPTRGQESVRDGRVRCAQKGQIPPVPYLSARVEIDGDVVLNPLRRNVVAQRRCG